MANQVYANSREVSCKAADGKSICAFPDVCLSPPSPPAGPIPIPYPNTGMASDMTDGSKTVKVSDKEVMLKDKSYFKKSTGDEAATKSLGMGVVTHQIQGKVYFTSWSVDVKFEGENVVRNLDLTTHNHASVPGNSPTWPYIDKMALAKANDPCHEDAKKERTACSKLKVKDKKGQVRVSITRKKQCAKTEDAKACREAQKCMLRPMKPKRCCKGEQAHHLVEVHCFSPAGGRKLGKLLKRFKGGYSEGKAPCVCASGPRSDKEHGALHAVQQKLEAAHHQKSGGWTYKDARQAGVLAHSLVYPGCKPGCIKKQLDEYHGQAKPDGPGCGDNTPLRTDPEAATRSAGKLLAIAKEAVTKAAKKILGVAKAGRVA